MTRQELGPSKVALIAADSYGRETKNAIDQALGLIGGIDKFVHTGDTVLIKPNLVNIYTAETGNTTHALLIKSLIEICHNAGANRIFVGDGSSQIDTRAAFITSGLKKVIDQLKHDGISVELVDLNHDRNPKTNEFETVNLGKDGVYPNYTYRIASTALNSDVIISVPKLKTHSLTGISVALKNMIGITPGEYYGFPRRRSGGLPHGSFSSPLHNDILWRVILDLNRIAIGKYAGSPKERSYVVVVDGVVAGTYNKAIDTGDEYWMAMWAPVKIGAIVAGFDPVAVDTVSARLMCYRPEKVPTIVHASERGLGTMSSIDVVGERVKNIRNFVPQPKGFLSTVDFGMPQLWSKAFANAVKTNVFERMAKTKSSVHVLLKKHNLCC